MCSVFFVSKGIFLIYIFYVYSKHRNEWQITSSSVRIFIHWFRRYMHIYQKIPCAEIYSSMLNYLELTSVLRLNMLYISRKMVLYPCPMGNKRVHYNRSIFLPYFTVLVLLTFLVRGIRSFSQHLSNIGNFILAAFFKCNPLYWYSFPQITWRYYRWNDCKQIGFANFEDTDQTPHSLLWY